MAWTKVTSINSASSNGALPFTSGQANTGSSDLIVVMASVYDNVTWLAGDLTDSASNVYTLLGQQAATGDAAQIVVCWYKFSPTNSATMTWTIDHAGHANGFPNLNIITFTGSTGVFDTSTSAGGSSVTSLQSSGSVGINNDLVVSGLGWYANNTMSIDSSFTIENQTGYTGSAHEGGALAWKVVSGAENPTWSWSGANQPATMLAGFKGTGGGSRGLFLNDLMAGMGTGGSFFRNPLG